MNRSGLAEVKQRGENADADVRISVAGFTLPRGSSPPGGL